MKRQQKEPQRYYVVSNKAGLGHCLVEANSPTQAQSYAAQHFTDVRLATVKEAVRMQTDGTAVVRWTGRPVQTDIEDVTGPPPSREFVPPAKPDGPVFMVSSGEEQPLHDPDRRYTVVNEDAIQPKLTEQTRKQPKRMMAADVFGKGFGKADDV